MKEGVFFMSVSVCESHYDRYIQHVRHISEMGGGGLVIK